MQVKSIQLIDGQKPQGLLGELGRELESDMVKFGCRNVRISMTSSSQKEMDIVSWMIPSNSNESTTPQSGMEETTNYYSSSNEVCAIRSNLVPSGLGSRVY